MTVNTDRLLWAITDLRVIGGTCDYLTQDYVSVIVVASLQKEIPMPKVCVATEHDKPKMTVVEIVIPDSYIQSPAVFSTSNIPDSRLLASFFFVFRFRFGFNRKFADKKCSQTVARFGLLRALLQSVQRWVNMKERYDDDSIPATHILCWLGADMEYTNAIEGTMSRMSGVWRTLPSLDAIHLVLCLCR